MTLVYKRKTGREEVMVISSVMKKKKICEGAQIYTHRMSVTQLVCCPLNSKNSFLYDKRQM